MTATSESTAGAEPVASLPGTSTDPRRWPTWMTVREATAPGPGGVLQVGPA